MPQVIWMEPERGPNFPPTAEALDNPNGLLAIGGKLDSSWLLSAYTLGIFPWFSEGEPIMWWSPSPRMIMEPGTAHISRSLKKLFRKSGYTVKVNRSFDDVIDYCSDPTLRHEGTWITDDIKNAYKKLHNEGWAHSFEVYEQNKLIGGLYGIGIDGCFFGESMFSLAPSASKFAFIALSEWAKKANLRLIDCQLHNPYLESLGAFLIGRDKFESKLPKCMDKLQLDSDNEIQHLLSTRLLNDQTKMELND